MTLAQHFLGAFFGLTKLSASVLRMEVLLLPSAMNPARASSRRVESDEPWPPRRQDENGLGGFGTSQASSVPTAASLTGPCRGGPCLASRALWLRNSVQRLALATPTEHSLPRHPQEPGPNATQMTRVI